MDEVVLRQRSATCERSSDVEKVVVVGGGERARIRVADMCEHKFCMRAS